MHRAHAVALALAHHVQGHAGGAAPVVEEQVEDKGVLDQLDTAGLGFRADRLLQGPEDLRAGGVPARVGDAVAQMAALAGQLQLAVPVAVEAGAQLDEAAHRLRALGDQDAHGGLVAQAHAGDQGVLQVQLGRVFRVEGGGSSRRTARPWSPRAP